MTFLGHICPISLLPGSPHDPSSTYILPCISPHALLTPGLWFSKTMTQINFFLRKQLLSSIVAVITKGQLRQEVKVLLSQNRCTAVPHSARGDTALGSQTAALYKCPMEPTVWNTHNGCGVPGHNAHVLGDQEVSCFSEWTEEHVVWEQAALLQGVWSSCALGMWVRRNQCPLFRGRVW